MSKQDTAVNFLIHSINEDMFQLSKSESEWKEIFKKAKEMEQTNSIEDLITRNYNAQIRRGQINDETNAYEFIEKIDEEVEELNMSIHKLQEKFKDGLDSKELADIILVCFSMAKHFNIDIMQVLSEKVDYNEKRVD